VKKTRPDLKKQLDSAKQRLKKILAKMDKKRRQRNKKKAKNVSVHSGTLSMGLNKLHVVIFKNGAQ
jgi:hypothetical protein